MSKGKVSAFNQELFGYSVEGTWLCDVKTRSKEDYVKFPADDEGLNASHRFMNNWLDQIKPCKQSYPNLIIDPLNLPDRNT